MKSLKFVRVTLFVEDLEAQTTFYGDSLHLPPVDVRTGWSEFGHEDVTIALHKGKGRKPRLEFITKDNLENTRDYLNERGARLGPIKERLGKRLVAGKDKDGNSIQITEQT